MGFAHYFCPHSSNISKFHFPTMPYECFLVFFSSIFKNILNIFFLAEFWTKLSVYSNSLIDPIAFIHSFYTDILSCFLYDFLLHFANILPYLLKYITLCLFLILGPIFPSSGMYYLAFTRLCHDYNQSQNPIGFGLKSDLPSGKHNFLGRGKRIQENYLNIL